MSDIPGGTREGLALVLLDRIARAEGKHVGAAYERVEPGRVPDRSYTLGLLRDILQVIDGGRSPGSSDAQVVSINSGQPSQAG
jgi:hypothetical protein